MNSGEPVVPAALRDRVSADLRPVRPLADPWKRALLLAPVALVVVAAVHARYGTRGDLGGVLLWGASLLQMAVGLGIVTVALRGVVPGRALPLRAEAMFFVLGLAVAIGVTYVAWHASGTIAPEALRYRFWKTCFRGTIEAGLPPLVVIVALAARGVMWRPGLVGALAGLSAGLIADASWRTFCEVAEPAHVLTAHFAGVVVLAVLGAGVGRVLGWSVAADSRRR